MKKTKESLTDGQIFMFCILFFAALVSGGYLPIGLEILFGYLSHRAPANYDPFMPLVITAAIGTISASITIWRRYSYWHYALIFNVGFIMYLVFAGYSLGESKVAYTVVSYAYGVSLIIPIAIIAGRLISKTGISSPKPSSDTRRVGNVILR